MPKVLDGSHLTIEDVVAVAREGESVELPTQSEAAIRRCRELLERKMAAGEIMYGINTGIGELADVVLNDEQVGQFQRYLIYNHAAGIGDPMPIEVVRASMLSRVNLHAKGYSACRVEIPRTYVAMLNRGLTPIVCQKGCVLCGMSW